MKSKMKMSLWKKIAIITASVLVVMAGAFFIYTGSYYHAEHPVLTEALAQADGSKGVDITPKGNSYVFTPSDRKPETALIFYPGGKVEYTAYADLMQIIAKEGYLCILVKMPFNLAVFDMNAAEEYMDTYDTIKNWYVGGHSLGGAMAAEFAAKNSDKLTGLVLLGAYPASDLSSSSLKVLSMYGSMDQVMNREKFEAGLKLMPKEHEEFEIAGGNHAQFGSYGKQKGDGEAVVSQEEQQNTAAKEISGFMSKNP